MYAYIREIIHSSRLNENLKTRLALRGLCERSGLERGRVLLIWNQKVNWLGQRGQVLSAQYWLFAF